MKLHALGGQHVGQEPARLAVLAGQQHRRGLDDLDACPEPRESLGQLAARGTAAQHGERRWQLPQVPERFGCQEIRACEPGNRRNGGPRSGGDDRRPEAQLAAARIHDAWPCEASKCAHHLHALRLEMFGGVAHAGPADHVLYALHDPGEVDPRLGGLESDAVRAAHLVRPPGGRDQALRGNATREETVSARLPGLLYERHPRADSRRVDRGDQPCGAATEDNQVIASIHPTLDAFRTPGDSDWCESSASSPWSKFEMRRLWIIAPIALVLALVIVAVTGDDQRSRDGPAASRGAANSDVLRVDKAGWKTDFSKHSVPLSEFESGGPPRDGIPPIDKPRPTSQMRADKWLADREPVLAVAVGHEVRAYPLQILVWHEIVNDALGNRLIAVTYCPLCNSSLVFDRRVGDRTLSFGTTGNLRRSDLVMWDRQTESWWQQLTAEAVVGRLTGTHLKVLPAQLLSWADFKRVHPDGDVLSRDTGFQRDYGRNPYVGYDQPDSEPFLFGGKPDGRLPPKERVVAIFAHDDTVVVPFSRLARNPVVEVDAGGRRVVVLYKRGVASPLDAPSIAGSRDVGTAAAFDARVGGRTLTFERRAGGFADRETGSRWDIAGRAVAGELAGERLTPVRHDQQFWFALAAFVPDARIER